MTKKDVYQCQCENCSQSKSHPDKESHRLMNLFLTRLDEQQRRWYVGMEAKKLGHGGTKKMAQITGTNINTIRRGKRELTDNLETRPKDRVRLPGGGRKAVEKNARYRNGTEGRSRRCGGRRPDE